MFRNAFGNDPAVWREASPARNVAAGKGIPDFHVITRGTPHRVGEARAFADSLEAAGVRADLVVARGMSHEEVNDAIGAARRHPHHPRPHGLLPHLRPLTPTTSEIGALRVAHALQARQFRGRRGRLPA